VTDLAEPTEYKLADRFRWDEGRVFLSGLQALARVPLEQLRADSRAGIRSAAFVSGYPGSPLAGFDRAIADASRAAPELAVVLRPGLNEELAATAVMGSQLVTTIDGHRYDGVVGIWYGKAPGLDRASDALRHAVFAGTSPFGGAVAIVGDDPAAKSSTLPSSSDATLVDLHIPVLYPGDVQEALDLGRHAVALSRASGLWTSLKVVAAVADGTGTVELHPDRVTPVIPHVEVDGLPFVPTPSGRLLTPYTLDLEREFITTRLELARQYGVDNGLNNISVHGAEDWIGLAATGHTYYEMMEALRLLGFRGRDDLNAAGIRLLHLRLPVPLDPALVRRFGRDLAEIVVVEEKNPTLEWFMKDALYALAQRPQVYGKHDELGRPLLPASGALDADTIAPALRQRLQDRLGSRLAPLVVERGSDRRSIQVTAVRSPYFCSGCPHNTSTKVPDGALVGGGIGCHAMVAIMEPARVGQIVGLTAMGGEGAQWIGMAPFVEANHLFQNIGDGTYFHSGQLAVQAAVAAGVNITYKLLFNGHVAMTGGQQPEGQLGVPNLAQILLLQGVKRVLITTEDVGRYRRINLPEGVEVWDRSRIIEAQQALAEIPGVTVLIHDQECAAEIRRSRKRGTAQRPGFRVVINERVCEGCGDCGDKSNCLSVQPVATPFGRKTRIDQTSCNLDLSCLEGDCPSFMTVKPARKARRSRAKRSAPGHMTPVPEAFVSDLPLPPPLAPSDSCTIRLSGIGGTGVVTVSQILGTAALLEDWLVRGLDQTGLSQKAGPVVSDLRLTRGTPQPSNKASKGSVDVLLAFDLLAAASDAHREGASPDRTVVFGSSSPTPTGEMVVHPDRPYPAEDVLRARLDSMSRAARNQYVDASGITENLFGDSTSANVFLLGVAYQAGALPVAAPSVERAIELNGVAVERNLAAFRWGRRWVADPETVRRLMLPATDTGDAERTAAGIRPPLPGRLQELFAQIDERTRLGDLVALRAADLVAYKSVSYAKRYLTDLVDVLTAEQTVSPLADELTEAVAVHLYQLMAYKDEYEVARLLLAPQATEAAEAVGGPGARVTWRLHPPLLRSLGVKRKLRFGRWARPLLGLLRAGRRLRGTPLDLFGWAKVRRLERRLVKEYRAAVAHLCTALTLGNHREACRIAALPDAVRGYETLKLQRAEVYRRELQTALSRFEADPVHV
jgi:indolepyruvate ferredoxin oxidoreductase